MVTVYILILIITVPFEFSILSGDINHSGLPFVRQWRSVDYSKAPGIISQLEITNRVYARGVYHQVTMKYNFQVGNQLLEGGRYRYLEGSQNSEALIQRFSKGSAITVFYNPDDPKDSLLSPGLIGDDVFCFYKTLGSLYIMAIFWFICLPRILRAVLHPPAGGVKIICENGLKRVQLPWFNSGVVAGASGVISLACCSTFLRSRPVSPLSASAGLFCSIAVAFMVYFYLWWRIRSGRHNLDINKDLGVVTLPGGRRIIKISEISAVTLEVNVTRNDRGQLNFCFVPSLRLRLPHSKSIALVSWTERSRSESFVGWLSTELGIP